MKRVAIAHQDNNFGREVLAAAIDSARAARPEDRWKWPR
jgi:hypothetical protein